MLNELSRNSGGRGRGRAAERPEARLLLAAPAVDEMRRAELLAIERLLPLMRFWTSPFAAESRIRFTGHRCVRCGSGRSRLRTAKARRERQPPRIDRIAASSKHLHAIGRSQWAVRS